MFSSRGSVLPRRAPPSVVAESVAAELAQLEQLALGELRVQYRNHSRRIAPARISRPLLLRVLANHIQAEAWGDLLPETRRMLHGLAAAAAKEKDGRQIAVPPVQASGRLKPATLLSREWQGRMEQVTVLEEGFAWAGKTHASLSAVAFAITGTKWNGHRFFGLRDRQKKPACTDDRKRSNTAKDVARAAPASSAGSGAISHAAVQAAGGQP